MTTNARPTRNHSIDLLRGVVMVVMVLDHARDFFFGMNPNPTDLAHTTPALFATRWITHFCAPVFVFLAGTSAYLYGTRHGQASVARFLLTRGLWLVALELTVVRLAWIPDPGYHITIIQVIWAIGWSMVALAGISRLGLRATLIVGAVIVAGHDLLDPIDHMKLGAWQPLWSILHARGELEPAPGHAFYISYPVLPWIGVIALGYCAGWLYERPALERRRWLVRLGLGAIALFVLIRLTNWYGDPSRWSVQPRGALYTAFSFLNASKYPPSLSFVLMTLGPALCLLALLEAAAVPSWLEPIRTYGRTPLLFYVTHLYLLRYVSAPIAFARFGAAAFKPPPGHAGSPELGLPVAYLAWLCALLLLYPLCRWFAKVKERNRAWWLSYL